MEKKTSPFICQIFICTNDRQGTRKSCSDGHSPKIRAMLKQEVAEKGWNGKVRVSASGCLGLCNEGPNIIIYPQMTWFSGVTAEDIPEIMDTVEDIINDVSME